MAANQQTDIQQTPDKATVSASDRGDAARADIIALIKTDRQAVAAAQTAASRSQEQSRPLIRPRVRGHGWWRPRWARLLPAWSISLLIHTVLLGMMSVVTAQPVQVVVPREFAIIETTVLEEEPEEFNLEIEDIGLEPDFFLNYDLERLDDISVPGPELLTEPIGIVGAPEGPPMNLSPPPGFGGDHGQGGGLHGPEFGEGNFIGTAGGLGGDPLANPGALLAGRSGATRERALQQGGGNTESEAAVARGLHWLVSHQHSDGHWSLDGFHAAGRCNCGGFGQKNDIAATAFGLLPLLGAGQTHKGTGHNHAYAKNVEKGLRYLLIKQNHEGYFGGGLYAHGLATIVVCEAYGLSGDPVLKAPAQRALNYILKAQHSAGGWRYSPGQAGDTSVTGWQLQALKSGQMAGLSVPRENLKLARGFLASVASPDGSTYGYTTPGARPSMTAVALLCRQYLGWGPRNPSLARGVEYLKRFPPGASKDIYFYYYATQVMHFFGGESWQEWNEGSSGKPGMRDLLLRTQDMGTDRMHLHQKGSWLPQRDRYGSSGGRLMQTSLSLLTLEVYYRYLPLYRQDTGGMKDLER